MLRESFAMDRRIYNVYESKCTFYHWICICVIELLAAVRLKQDEWQCVVSGVDKRQAYYC